MLRYAAILLSVIGSVSVDDPDPPGFRRAVFKSGIPADIRRAVEAGTAERLDDARSLWRSVDFQTGVVARLRKARVIPPDKGTKFAPAISAAEITGRLREAEAELAGYLGQYSAVCDDVGHIPMLRRKPASGSVGRLPPGRPGETLGKLADGRLVRTTGHGLAALGTGPTSVRPTVRYMGRINYDTPFGLRTAEVFEPVVVHDWTVTDTRGSHRPD